MSALLRPMLVSNVLLVLAALCMGALHLAVTRGWARPRGAVRALRLTVLLALALPCALVLLPSALPIRVQALVVAAGADAQATLAQAVPALLRKTGGGGLPWLLLAEAAILLGVAFALWRGSGYVRLVLRVRQRPLIRRIGRVELRLGEEGSVPASVRLPGRAVVLLPEPLLLLPPDLRIALAHELEHHRRGDAAWALADTLLRALFFWNPALHLLSRLADGWQELACDDAVISFRRVSPGAYAACLVRSAERALRPHLSPATVGMAAHGSTNLRKRVDRMFTNRSEKSWPVKLATGAAVLCLGATALAAAGSGGTRTHGELSKAAIQETIRAHASAVKGCYEKAVRESPGLHGKLVVRFVIGQSGAVKSAEAATVELSGPSPKSTLPEMAKRAGDQVSSCVISAVKGWRFPAPSGGGEVTVAYPFTFVAE